MANLAFDDTVSPEMAHQIIKTAGELTYRQLCILRLYVVKGRSRMRNGNYFDTDNFPIQLRQILYEYHDLNARVLGSVDISRHSGESRNPGALKSRYRSHSGYSGFPLSRE